jgi:hypothetical protein
MGATQSSNNNRSDAVSKPSSQTYPLVGPNDIMRKKQHGTSHAAVQEELRWEVSRKKADNICNFNRHWAEPSGEWGQF